jgi:hypothetical protein
MAEIGEPVRRIVVVPNETPVPAVTPTKEPVRVPEKVPG